MIGAIGGSADQRTGKRADTCFLAARGDALNVRILYAWNVRIATGTSVSIVNAEAFEMDERRAYRLALAPLLLLGEAVTSSLRWRVNAPGAFR